MPAPKKPSKANKVLGITAAILAVLIVAGFVYLQFFAAGNSSNVEDSSSRSAPVSSSSSRRTASSSSSSAQSEAAPEPEADTGPGFIWVMDYSLELDSIASMRNYSSRTDTTPYISVRFGDTRGVAHFDDPFNFIFEPYDGGGVYFCPYGFAHNLPPEIEARSSVEEQNEMMRAMGFPFETDGNHGFGPTLAYAWDPSTGEMQMGYFGYGEFYVPTEGIPSDSIPETIRYIDISAVEYDSAGFITNEDEVLYGLATRGGERLLDPVYDEISVPYNGVRTLRQGERFGYYSVDGLYLISDCIWQRTWLFNSQELMPGVFDEGLCPVRDQDGYAGFMDLNGNLVVEPQFNGVSHVYGNRAWVSKDGLWGMIEFTR